MDNIRNYILSVLSAAIICGIFRCWFSGNSTYGKLIQLLTGLFLSITLVSPLLKLEISSVSNVFDGISEDADKAAIYGEQLRTESMSDIIKAQTEAYILDKAASWELNLAVEVTLSESDPPVPCGVELKGSVSPYAKSQLIKWIESDLGISEDHQEWK